MNVAGCFDDVDSSWKDDESREKQLRM